MVNVLMVMNVLLICTVLFFVQMMIWRDTISLLLVGGKLAGYVRIIATLLHLFHMILFRSSSL